MSNDAAIRVNNVSKNFILPHMRKNTVKSLFTSLFDSSNRGKSEVQHALKDVSFEIKKGEFFGIVGRNGSGKSTLLKMLAGIYQPTKGTIQVNGKLVPFIELGVGFNPELTGRENVYLNGALLGFDEKQIDAMYDDIVQFAELEKFMDQKLKNYSSGMQVRLAFSVATILAQSDILLIDEVLAVGDAEFQRKCFNYFNTLKKNKKTVVFVSHDMNAIKEYCDKAVLIEEGKVACMGSAVSVAREYAKLFIPDEENSAQTQGMRWGNRYIVFNKISVNPKKITNQDITIRVNLKANSQVNSPIVGFSIKNAADQPITGTNSQISGIDFGKVEKGAELILEWRITNILNDGKYFLNLAVETEDREPCDWWEEAVEFDVYKDSTTGFAVDLPIKTTLIK